jgi:hypothetical protein
LRFLVFFFRLSPAGFPCIRALVPSFSSLSNTFSTSFLSSLSCPSVCSLVSVEFLVFFLGFFVHQSVVMRRRFLVLLFGLFLGVSFCPSVCSYASFRFLVLFFGLFFVHQSVMMRRFWVYFLSIDLFYFRPSFCLFSNHMCLYASPSSPCRGWF